MAMKQQRQGDIPRNTHNTPRQSGQADNAQAPRKRRFLGFGAAAPKNEPPRELKNTRRSGSAAGKTSAQKKDGRSDTAKRRSQTQDAVYTPRRADPAARHKANVAAAILGSALCAAGLVFAIYSFSRWAMTSDYFALKEISVTGNTHVSDEEVVRLAGLEPGRNIFSVSLAEAKRRIMTNHWVAAVTIDRTLPSRVSIGITEREPKFWVLRDHTLYYIDKDANLIAPLESDNFVSLPALEIGPGGENMLADLDAFMEKVRTAKLPFDLGQISKLRLSAANGFELYWEKRRLVLSLAVEDWEKNLAALASAITDLEKKKEIGAVREISAADGKVWVQRDQ
ncbi:MAG: FtsQ-type POTRA domain-containing protein [Mailhella sp.]|nr:FtsQ-type POTRA domain-containing protein [Mailhella sp.]